MNRKEHTEQRRTQSAIKMFENAHQGCGEAHGFLWLDVNQAIVKNLQAGGFTDNVGGYDYITKGLVSMAARTALDIAKEKQNAELTTARTRIAELETALRALVEFDDKNYYQRVHITKEPEVMKQARAALEVKP